VLRERAHGEKKRQTARPKKAGAKMLPTAAVLTAHLNCLTAFGVSQHGSAYIGSV